MKARLSEAIDNLLESRDTFSEDINNQINNFIFRIENNNNPNSIVKQYIINDVNDLNKQLDLYCKYLKEAVNEVLSNYIK